MAFYLIPITLQVNGGRSIRMPKYVPDMVPGPAWALVDWHDTAIIWVDSTPAQDAFLAAQPDVTVIPALDSTVNLTAVQNALEALDIPAGWVQAGMTYRTVLRVVVGMAQLIQRTAGLGEKLPVSGGALDLTIGSLAAQRRQRLTDAVDSLGLDRSSITLATTVREALRIVGQQFAQGRTIALGDL